MISKSFVLLFLLGMLFIKSSEPCEHLDIIPHPQWCSAFFLCRFGFWTVLVCPGGLMYNHETRRCDFPENVDCINDPELTTPEWTSPTWTTRTVTWTTPTIPTFSTPSVPTFSTPSVPTFSTPSVPTFSTPSIPTFSTPSIPTFSTPSVPTFSTPSVPTFSTPSVPTFSTPSVPTFSTPSIPTFSTPSIPTFSTPSVPTFSTPTTPVWTTPTRPSIPTRKIRKNFVANISCSDSSLQQTLPHPLCQYFYKCINGNAIEMKCDDGMVYNLHREYCDYPAHVDC